MTATTRRVTRACRRRISAGRSSHRGLDDEARLSEEPLEGRVGHIVHHNCPAGKLAGELGRGSLRQLRVPALAAPVSRGSGGERPSQREEGPREAAARPSHRPGDNPRRRRLLSSRGRVPGPERRPDHGHEQVCRHRHHRQHGHRRDAGLVDRLDLYTHDIGSVQTEIAALTGLQDLCLKRLAGVLNRVPDLRGVAVAGEAGRDNVASQKTAVVVRGAAGANADLTQLISATTAAVGSYTVLHSQ